MLNALESILELNRDPMLVLADGKIHLMNSAARKAFPGSRIGDGASDLIPDLIVFDAAKEFISSVSVGAARYVVTAARCDGMLWLTLTPDRPASENRGFLSEALMSGMLSTLFNIRLSADRIRDAAGEGAVIMQSYLSMLDHNYYKLLRSLSNLNALCALGDGSMELTLRRVDLVTLCSDIASSTTLLTRGLYAPVEFCTELDTLPAYMDAPKVEQLILNLLSNSLMHTPQDGQVRLKLARSGSNALICVSDSGSGIAPVRLKNVFTGFQGCPDLLALAADPGSGIGLALCRIITEKHGGTLILESRAGEGTDIRALLPLMPPGAAELMSSGPEYANGGMEAILTELSDLLDTDAYGNCRPE